MGLGCRGTPRRLSADVFVKAKYAKIDSDDKIATAWHHLFHDMIKQIDMMAKPDDRRFPGGGHDSRAICCGYIVAHVEGHAPGPE